MVETPRFTTKKKRFTRILTQIHPKKGHNFFSSAFGRTHLSPLGGSPVLKRSLALLKGTWILGNPPTAVPPADLVDGEAEHPLVLVGQLLPRQTQVGAPHRRRRRRRGEWGRGTGMEDPSRQEIPSSNTRMEEMDGIGNGRMAAAFFTDPQGKSPQPPATLVGTQKGSTLTPPPVDQLQIPTIK